MNFKIVIDTNVWIKYAANGKIYHLIKLIVEHNLDVYADGQILAEIHRTLLKPNVISSNSIIPDEIVDLVKMVTLQVVPSPQYFLCPDMKDNFLFDIALQWNCLFIVTDEKALLRFSNSPVLVKSLRWLKEQFPVEE